MIVTADTRALAAALLDPVRTAVERGLAGSALALGDVDAAAPGAEVTAPTRPPAWVARTTARAADRAPARTSSHPIDGSLASPDRLPARLADSSHMHADQPTRPAPSHLLAPHPATPAPARIAASIHPLTLDASLMDPGAHTATTDLGLRTATISTPRASRPDATPDALASAAPRDLADARSDAPSIVARPLDSATTAPPSATAPAARSTRLTVTEDPTRLVAPVGRIGDPTATPVAPITSPANPVAIITSPANPVALVEPLSSAKNAATRIAGSPIMPAAPDGDSGVRIRTIDPPAAPLLPVGEAQATATKPSAIDPTAATSRSAIDPSVATGLSAVDSTAAGTRISAVDRSIKKMSAVEPSAAATKLSATDSSAVPVHHERVAVARTYSPAPTIVEEPPRVATADVHAFDPTAASPRDPEASSVSAPTVTPTPAAPASPGLPIRSLAAAPVRDDRVEPPSPPRADAAIAGQVAQAMRPILEHAAALTDAAMETPAQPRVANHFSVNVQLGARSDVLDPDALGATLVDMLREAARRHGLEV